MVGILRQDKLVVVAHLARNSALFDISWFKYVTVDSNPLSTLTNLRRTIGQQTVVAEGEHVLWLLVLYGRKSRNRTGEFNDYIGTKRGALPWAFIRSADPSCSSQRHFTRDRLRVIFFLHGAS